MNLCFATSWRTFIAVNLPVNSSGATPANPKSCWLVSWEALALDSFRKRGFDLLMPIRTRGPGTFLPIENLRVLLSCRCAARGGFLTVLERG